MKYADALYTYVPKNNTLDTDGLYGPWGDSEENLVKRYGRRAQSDTKQGVLDWLESIDPGRSHSLSVLTEPIPATADQRFLDFANKNQLVKLPSIKVLLAAGLIHPEFYKSNGGKKLYKRKRVSYKPIDWNQNEDGLLFKHIPHYMLIADNPIPPEYLEKQAADKEERTLRRLAKPYYVEHGKNSWEHVNQVLKSAEAMTQQIYGRPLTLEEKAAILFHDSAVLPYGTHKEHGQHAKDMAIPILLGTGMFNQKQLDDIGTAILEHDTLDNTGGPFTSTTGEVLASGDANPPELPWLLNKMYSWQIQNNSGTNEAWKENIYNTATKLYGTGSNFKYPGLYNAFHKDRMQKMRETISNSTPDELWDIVTKYRKKHKLGDRESKFPAPTLMKAAKLLYHGSPRGDLDVLSTDATKAVHGADGHVFMTPDRLLAACFLLDKQRVMDRLEKQFGHRINSSTVGYDVWNMTPEKRAKAKAIKVLVKDVPGIKPFTMKQRGYIYGADVPEDRISQYRDSDLEHEVLVSGDVTPITKERVTVPYRIQSVE